MNATIAIIIVLVIILLAGGVYWVSQSTSNTAPTSPTSTPTSTPAVVTTSTPATTSSPATITTTPVTVTSTGPTTTVIVPSSAIPTTPQSTPPPSGCSQDPTYGAGIFDCPAGILPVSGVLKSGTTIPAASSAMISNFMMSQYDISTPSYTIDGIPYWWREGWP